MSKITEELDLVIVGAGPAGLMAAAWATVYNLRTVLIDKRADKIFNGHADGLQSRTLEILHSFGFGDSIYREANRLQEVCFWNPDSTGRIRRTDRIPDTIPGISRFQQSVLHQGRIEQHFFDFIEKDGSTVSVWRPFEPVELEIDESLAANDDAYPVTVHVRPTTEGNVEGTTNGEPIPAVNVLKCKYLIGCDGSHSWVRKKLGLVMEGAQTESVWGVMDIKPITNFPDIRMRCAIHSASKGSVMVIPRERGLVRLYIQLADIRPAKGERFDKSKGSKEIIFEAAQKILEPYHIAYEHCEWWTIYQIGQRVGNHYGVQDRVFLAGDAVHTHSPKAGQGMNVSMHDTYNLGWKIGSVVNKTLNRSILTTYESERRKVAMQLIEFDIRFSRMFSGRPAMDMADEAGISMSEFKATFEKGNEFTSGISVKYAESVLVASQPETASNVSLSRGRLQVGMRFPSFQAVCQCDATPVQLGDVLKSDGLWRLVAFPGDLTSETAQNRLKFLGDRFGAFNDILDQTLVELVLVHCSKRQDVELFEIPRPFYCRGVKDEYDYYRIFADDLSYHHGHGSAYENYGVSKDIGRLVLVRPDQYISWMGDIEDMQKVVDFMASIVR